jgi:NAD(P)H-dependent FMN reductase
MDLFEAHEGLLISSPEYNSSITGVLKNTIDWVSRPVPGKPPLHAFAGKVALLVAASPGALGGLRGLVTLRSILSNIKVLVLPDQLAVPKAGEAFGADGRLADPRLQASIEKLGATLVDAVGRWTRAG